MSLAASTISHGPLPTNSSSSSSGVVRFVSPLVILRVAYEDGQSSCVLQQRSGGGGAQNEGPSLDQLVLQHRNCFLDARAPTGLESRKREPFCVGDVWLLLATPKENYNYLFTTQKGFKYINVLDRQRVVSAVTEAAAPPLSAAAAAAHESAAAEAAALSAGHKLRVFALDPAKPVLLPGDEETPQHASTSAAAAAAAAQQQRAELHWLLPQWFEGEADMLLWAAAPGASSEQDASSSSSSSTRLLRVQRPLHLRSCSVLCRGFSFEEVLKEMVAIEAARRAKRPLDTFAYKTAKPAAAAPAAAAASAMGGQQQVRKMPGRTSAASLLAHPRPQPSSSRFCVLDEVCVHLKRRPVLLLPSLAASGPGCLLTRENVKTRQNQQQQQHHHQQQQQLSWGLCLCVMPECRWCSGRRRSERGRGDPASDSRKGVYFQGVGVYIHLKIRGQGLGLCGLRLRLRRQRRESQVAIQRLAFSILGGALPILQVPSRCCSHLLLLLVMVVVVTLLLLMRMLSMVMLMVMLVVMVVLLMMMLLL
ncbi:hypothetical protein Esti_001420 [Eimeria stiedai]